MRAGANPSPALTYTLEDFIDMKYLDETTFYNFSILEKYEGYDGVEHLDHNLIEDYLDLLETVDAELDDQQFKRYKYKPDLLAYEVYGSTQLDFIILMINDMCDPKEFNRKKIKLPYASTLFEFLDLVYATNSNYIEDNRERYNIDMV
jgi:hypothetical protein